MQVTSIVVEGTLYYYTPFNRVFALDPETGEERWVFDPGVAVSQEYLLVCRGVSSWLDREATGGPCGCRGQCSKRPDLAQVQDAEGWT